MFEAIIVLVIIVFIIFGIVVFFGAPYLPTFKTQSKEALKLLDLKKGEQIIELGCGDGRVMIMALEQGYRVVGYELNPVLALVSWLKTRKYGKKSTVIWGSFWRKNWPESEGLYVFLHTKFMKKLDKKILEQLEAWQLNNGDELSDQKAQLSVVSYVFEIPDKRSVKKKAQSKEKSRRLN
jgi:16S rRNA A1518/A1519 N6-dimethyltransferase RsmA/KsgA/DIM1 with predicted DNA glycosylase/AP lyase activity